MIDTAELILAAEPSLSDSQRAILWDVWHAAATVSSLARQIGELEFNIPKHVEQALLETKKLRSDAISSVDRTVSAINRLSKIDPQVLHLMERYPHVLQHVTDSLKKE